VLGAFVTLATWWPARVPDRAVLVQDSRYVWAILAGSAVGLLAST